MNTTRLRVRLRDVEPTVLRVLDVPAASTLPELHALLQAALGWQDTHLHEFVTDQARFCMPEDERQDLGAGSRDGRAWRSETGVALRELGTCFVYHYDFGDGWEHDVDVLGPGGDRPGCPYGEGACPPEDSGGPAGHRLLLTALADPAHPEHTRLREWAGELPDFDQAATDELVVQTVGAVPAGVRLVLDLAADGVKLTPGGRFPRAFVRQVQERRPDWAFDARPAPREDHLVPLVVLHDILREVGLLRLSRGVVSPIKAAADDLQVLRRLRSWFAADRFRGVLATLVVATLAGHGPCSSERLSGLVLPRLGPGWTIDGEPLDQRALQRQISWLHSPMLAMDLLVDLGHFTVGPGPSARTLLPRAAALARRWAGAPTPARSGAE